MTLDDWYRRVCYELGLIGMILVLLAETVFNTLGWMIHYTPEYIVEIYCNEKTCLDQELWCCKDSRMAIANLNIHMLDGKGPSLYAAEVKVRGNTRPEPLTEQISHMNGAVNVTAL